jgi:hypothetical protein
MHAERLRKHGALDAGAFKPRGTCQVEGCEKAHYGHGFCGKHWKRWKAWGDPLGGSTGWGEARQWIENVLSADAGDCIVYPFSRDQSGYGHAHIDGKYVGVHAYVLKRTQGHKPTPAHEACHTCGNGHLGCVHPKHLYWGTRSQNIADAIAAGTWNHPVRFGEAASAAKYSDEQISEVRRLRAGGMTQVAISKVTSISQAHVSRILAGHRLR